MYVGAPTIATHPADAVRYESLTKLIPKAMEVYKTAVGSYPKGYVPGIQ